MDLGNISGKFLKLPKQTTIYVIDFKSKSLKMKVQIENSKDNKKELAQVRKAILSLNKSNKVKKTA